MLSIIVVSFHIDEHLFMENSFFFILNFGDGDGPNLCWVKKVEISLWMEWHLK